MFPFRTSSIFRSRWIALLWAGGVIWTAVSLVPERQHSGDAAPQDQPVTTDVTGAPVTEAQLRKAEELLQKMGQ